MSMEQNGNQNIASAIFCRNGCGFYAAQAFDGMCSKCYKDLKQQNQSAVTAVQSPASTPSASRTSLVGGDGHDNVDSVATALSKTSLGEMNLNTSSNSGSNDKLNKLGAVGGSEVETASPTVATAKAVGSEKDSKEDLAEGSSADVSEGGSSDGEKSKKPKKNRCMECRKKVGLTGFTCHCGKLFCSLHRYSDTHDCTFDFKEKGQREIRKNNPVVKGEKIQKI